MHPGKRILLTEEYLEPLQKYLPLQLAEHAKWAGQGESLNLKPLWALLFLVSDSVLLWQFNASQ